MGGFIHGEISWSGHSEITAGNVELMLTAVNGHPWVSSALDAGTGPSPVWALGVQRTPEGDGSQRAQPPREGLIRSSEDGLVRVVADIQLHARTELAARLGLSLGAASALSDETLIICSYRRWGTEFAHRLTGEGAFALWDDAAQRLICWRDAAGARPLYFNHDPGCRLVFSSDLQSIAAHPGASPTLDLAHTRAFLQNELFQHPTRTFLLGVSKLEPAHILIFDREGLSLRRYWDPMAIAERKSADDRECVEELRVLLRQAIDDRVPSSGCGVGAHLSGGLDSSSIAVMTASLLSDRGQQLNAFSWSPPRELVPAVDLDERDLIDAVARHTDIVVHNTTLRPRDILDIGFRDVPLRPRTTLNFEISTSRQAVASGVRTMLSGWGGDEAIAFNGRGYFADLARRGHLNTVQREFRMRSEIQRGGSLLGAWKHRVVWPLIPDWVFRGRVSKPGPLPPELRPEFAQMLESVAPSDDPQMRERPGVHLMQARLLQFGHLSARMEAWVAHGATIGLTYRFPLLDRRIMEFALALPGRMFFQQGWKRWLYREAMEGLLPDEVRWNPVKFDNAAVHHLQTVTAQPYPLYRERLLERRANPFVDVDRMVADLDRSTHDHKPRNPIAVGAWLAFTGLLPA